MAHNFLSLLTISFLFSSPSFRRAGRVDGKLVVNPPPESLDRSGWKNGGGVDLLYAGNEHRALMIEMGGGPIPEGLVAKALALAQEQVRADTFEYRAVYGRTDTARKLECCPRSRKCKRGSASV